MLSALRCGRRLVHAKGQFHPLRQFAFAATSARRFGRDQRSLAIDLAA